MKFAHFADIHIGSWRDAHLKELSTEVFCAAIDKCVSEQVDFIVLAGDLFNTSLPSVTQLKTVTKKLFALQSKDIPVYIIPGSHDFSPSGKTMIDVLEAAGLVTNVMKGDVVDEKIHLRFTVDPKTQAKLVGVIGKKGMLDRHYYESLALEHLEQESGFKIFLWHTAIEEFKPKGLEKMEAVPLSFLPKNFNYYAGGHVHVRMDKTPENYGRITLPGSLFPVNFDELEKNGHGGLYIYDDAQTEPLSWHPISLYPRLSLRFDCDGKNGDQVMAQFEESIAGKDFHNALVTLRFKGTLEGAKIADVKFRHMFDVLYELGAKAVVKNTIHLSTKEFEEIKISMASVDEVEAQLITEHIGGLNDETKPEAQMVKNLMKAFDTPKLEGEKVADFEGRISQEADSVLHQLL